MVKALEKPFEKTGIMRASERSVRVGLVLIRSGPAIILLGLILTFSLLSPVFFTGRNFTNIALQTAVLAALAVGQLFVILVAGIDLSVGSVLALSTVTGALVFHNLDAPGWGTIAVILMTGAFVGWFNGFIFVKGRMPHAFIPTLAMLHAGRGLALVLSDGRPLPGMPSSVVTAGSGYVGPVPVPVLLVAGFAIAAVILTRRLTWGRWIYAVGGNRDAARRAGIPVDRVIISVFVISGLAAGLAGLLTAGRTNSGYPTAGTLAELTAIASVIIGGASFFGGRGSVGGVLLGALILGVLQNGLNLLGVQIYWQSILIGVVVLVAVLMDVARRMFEERLRTLYAQH